MPQHWYSTQSFFAWCLNYYYYGGVHYTYLAAPFHPHRLKNPASSDPWHQYGAHYKPWRDDDPYDANLCQRRMGLADSIRNRSGGLSPSQEAALLNACARLSLAFFVPVVYRVDLDTIAASRRQLSNSGTTGSREWLVSDLRDGEFEVLFLDVSDRHLDPAVQQVASPLLGGPPLARKDVNRILTAALL